MAHHLYCDANRRFVETRNPDNDPVEFCDQGGGFVRRLSNADFHATFKPAQIPGFRKVRVTGDWREGLEPYDAYTNDMRWNGWAMPYFELEAAQRVAADFGATYDAQRDAFIFTDPSYDEPEVYAAMTIDTPDGTKKVYAVGAGSWCWELED